MKIVKRALTSAAQPDKLLPKTNEAAYTNFTLNEPKPASEKLTHSFSFQGFQLSWPVSVLVAALLLVLLVTTITLVQAAPTTVTSIPVGSTPRNDLVAPKFIYGAAKSNLTRLAS